MLLLALVARADDTFYPGADDRTVSYAAELTRGGVRGRTGDLLVEGPARVLAALPEVAEVDSLPGGVVRLRLRPGVDDLALARSLHARADVAWAVPDLSFQLVPTTVPNDPFFPSQWHLDNTGQSGALGVDINAPAAWDRATGAGQLIAILDSGVELTHPDLVVTAGFDYVDGDADPSPGTDDSAAHGTCAAGVAAAVGNDGYGVAGVAYDADVYAIRLIGGSTSLSDLYDSFTEAVDAGAAVLSNSWGWSDTCAQVTDYATFRKMFNYAEQNGRGGLGSAVVFSAGNGGCDIAYDTMLAYEQPIVVAAVESGDTRAWYSNYGDSVDISAPTNLLTTDLSTGGYGSYDGDEAFVDGFGGTSASAPVVAGVVALMFEANPRLTAAQARQVLCDTATRIDVQNAGYDDAGWSPYYGCGRIDAAAAVAAVVSEAPAAPVPTLVRDEVPVSRVLLVWDAAEDIDGDVQGYEVAWAVGQGADTEKPGEVTGTALDLTGQVEVGEAITWQVRAIDAWGSSEWSAPTTFVVVDDVVEVEVVEEEPAPRSAGCATVGSGQGATGLVGVALVGLGLCLVRRSGASERAAD